VAARDRSQSSARPDLHDYWSRPRDRDHHPSRLTRHPRANVPPEKQPTRGTIMAIKVGDKLPEAKFRVMGAEGPAWKTTDDVFKGKKVALFAVPGAFTPTCNNLHMPSFVN